MTNKIIKFVWPGGRTMDMVLFNNPAAEYYWQCAKHLQYLDLRFDVRKNPYHPWFNNTEILAKKLVEKGAELTLDVDVDQLSSQQYLNHLHTIYFKAVDCDNFDVEWLVFHDLLHALETSQGMNLRTHDIWVDFEERAGPLIKPFDRSLLEYATINREPGVAYIGHHELGKDPFTYFNDNEPNDISVMCELMKPWVDLKPVLNIETTAETIYNKFKTREAEFTEWFEPYRDAWQQHWKINNWSTQEIGAEIPVGRLEDIDAFVECFKQQDYPIRISR